MLGKVGGRRVPDARHPSHPADNKPAAVEDGAAADEDQEIVAHHPKPVHAADDAAHIRNNTFDKGSNPVQHNHHAHVNVVQPRKNNY